MFDDFIPQGYWIVYKIKNNWIIIYVFYTYFISINLIFMNKKYYWLMLSTRLIRIRCYSYILFGIQLLTTLLHMMLVFLALEEIRSY